LSVYFSSSNAPVYYRPSRFHSTSSSSLSSQRYTSVLGASRLQSQPSRTAHFPILISLKSKPQPPASLPVSFQSSASPASLPSSLQDFWSFIVLREIAKALRLSGRRRPRNCPPPRPGQVQDSAPMFDGIRGRFVNYRESAIAGQKQSRCVTTI